MAKIKLEGHGTENSEISSEHKDVLSHAGNVDSSIHDALVVACSVVKTIMPWLVTKYGKPKHNLFDGSTDTLLLLSPLTEKKGGTSCTLALAGETIQLQHDGYMDPSH